MLSAYSPAGTRGNSTVPSEFVVLDIIDTFGLDGSAERSETLTSAAG